MSGLDIAKALTEVDDSKFARVTYGVAQADSGKDYTDSDGNVIAGEENYVFVLLDGHTEVSKLRCDCYVKSGYRVKVVGDPSGRYLLYSMAGQVEELQAEDNNLQKQIDAIEDTKVKQTSSNDDHAHPILLKYTANADDDTANDETAGARYKNNVVINPSESAIRATDYYTNDNGQFHGDLEGNADTASKWTNGLNLSLTGVVSGDSDYFNGSETGVRGSHSNWNPKLSTSINCGTGLTVTNNALVNTGVTSINVSGSLSITGSTGSVTITGTDTNTDTMVTQAPKTDENTDDAAFPLLLKNTSSTTGTITDQVGYGAGVVANPIQGAVRANDYYGNNETPFHGNLDGYATSAGEAAHATSARTLDSSAGTYYQPIYITTSGGPTQCSQLGPFDGISTSQLYSSEFLDINRSSLHLHLSGHGYLAGSHSANTGNRVIGLYADEDAEGISFGYKGGTSGATYTRKLYYSKSANTWYFSNVSVSGIAATNLSVLNNQATEENNEGTDEEVRCFTPGTSAKLKFVAPLKIEDGAITEWSDVELTFRDGVLTDLKYPENYMQEV